MRSAGNFNPEWGYLAPAPNFVRTVRIVVVAAAIGATAGAAVVFSLTDHTGADESVAARTMAVETPATAAVGAATAASVQRTVAPAPSSQVGHAVAADSAKMTTMARPANAAVLAESPTVVDAVAAKSALGFEKLVKQPPPIARNPAQLTRPADRGPVALLRSLGVAPGGGPAPGDY
jgi:hypothetical protein